MENEKKDGFQEQIEAARKAFDEWPEWMKSAAYIASAEISGDSARKMFEESTEENARAVESNPSISR